MASNQPPGHQTDDRKSLVEQEDTLNGVIAKLSVLGDFFKHIGDDSFLLDPDTPLGLYLIMCDCIATLKKLGK